MIFIGGIGELVAPGTVDTPKSVLVASGTIVAILAVLLFVLTTAAAVERVRGRAAGKALAGGAIAVKSTPPT